jgi:hypothetical protein
MATCGAVHRLLGLTNSLAVIAINTMDQLKAYMAVAAKHWFWVATAAVTLLSVGIWWMSSSKLLSEHETARSQLESDAQKITTVRNMLSTHPNDISHQQMEALIEDRTQKVMDAWSSVFERQQDILVWPVDELQEDFVERFRDLIPIELKVTFPTPEEEEVVPLFRTRYQHYIGRVLPSIAEIAQSKWTADWDRAPAGAMGGYDGGYSGEMESYDPGGDAGYSQFGTAALREEGPLVTWTTASQEKLLADLFPWRGSQPTTLDVLYSQENLWILRQLMQIVADVNGDAGQRFQAKIRGIERIAIGRSVPKSAGTLSKPGSLRAGSAAELYGSDDMYGEDMMSEDYYSGSDGMGGMGDGYGGGEAVSADPGDDRYVDTQGTPLTASQLRSALSSDSPTDAFMAVAKRVPVMMAFKMDQRSVPQLLAACGSAPLMVEVRQVRILPSSAVAGAVSGAGDGYGGDAGYGGDSYGGESDYGGGMPSTAGGTAEKFPLDMTVEVYGIIYIYNPPREEAIGVDQVTEDIVVDGAIGDPRRGEADEPAGDAAPVPTPAPAATPETEPAPGPEQALPLQPESAPAAPAQPEPAPEAQQPAADPAAVPADGASYKHPASLPTLLGQDGSGRVRPFQSVSCVPSSTSYS